MTRACRPPLPLGFSNSLGIRLLEKPSPEGEGPISGRLRGQLLGNVFPEQPCKGFRQLVHVLHTD